MSRFVNPTSLPPPSTLDQFAARALFGNPQSSRINPMFAPDSFGGFGALLNTPTAAAGFKALGFDVANTQFAATQNAFDRLGAMQDAARVSKVASMTARGDARVFSNYANTVQRAFLGRNDLSQSELSQGRAFGDLVANNATTVMGAIGESTYDRLTGGRSSLLLGQKLQSTFNNAINPLSGTRAYDASYTASVTGALAGRSFDTASDRFALRGIRSGDMGNILGYMQNQGQLGLSAGLMSGQERRLAAIGTTFDDAAMRRIVEQTSGVKDLIAAGKTPPKELLAQTQAAVGQTLSKLRGGEMSTSDLSKMTGGAQILSEIDASRMRDKLQNVAKAVRTMKDIFGDEGQPNAPMQQVLQAIKGLTQGASRVLSPEKVNGMLREMQIVAKQSGVTVSEMTVGMQSAMQSLKEKGGSSAMAMPIVTQAYARVAAMRDRQGFENLGYGEDDASATTAREVEKRVAASTSQHGKQLATMNFLEEQGQLQPKANSKVAAYQAARKKGVTDFTHNGENYTTFMSEADFVSMIATGNDAQLGADTIANVLTNKTLIEEQFAKNPQLNEESKQGNNSEARQRVAAELASNSFSAQGTRGLSETTRKGIMSKFATSIGEYGGSKEMKDSSTRGALIRRQMVKETAAALKRDEGLTDAEALAKADTMISRDSAALMASAENAAQVAGANTFQEFARNTDTRLADQEATNQINNRLTGIDLDLASNQVGEDVLTRIGQAMSDGGLDPNATVMDVANQMLGGLTDKQKELLSNSKMGGALSAYVDGKQKLDGMREAAKTDAKAAESYAMRSNMLVALAQGGVEASNFLKSDSNAVRAGVTRGDVEKALGSQLFGGANPNAKLSAEDRLTLSEAEQSNPDMSGKLDSLRSADIAPSEYALMRQRATTDKHLFQELDSLGLAVGAKNTRGSIAGLAETTKAIAESTEDSPGTEKTQSAMSTYLTDLGKTVDSLYGDQTSLKQLGAGAVASLNAVSKSRQAIADTLKAKEVSLTDYMSSDKLTKDDKASIKAELDKIQKETASWDDAKDTEAKAGFGRNKRAPISDAELKDASIIAAKLAEGKPNPGAKPSKEATEPKITEAKPNASWLVAEPVLKQVVGTKSAAEGADAGVGVTPQGTGDQGSSRQSIVLSGTLTVRPDGTADLNATGANDKANTLNSMTT